MPNPLSKSAFLNWRQAFNFFFPFAMSPPRKIFNKEFSITFNTKCTIHAKRGLYSTDYWNNIY